MLELKDNFQARQQLTCRITALKQTLASTSAYKSWENGIKLKKTASCVPFLKLSQCQKKFNLHFSINLITHVVPHKHHGLHV